MTTIVFKSNQANYQLPVFPHITYNKVTVELNGGSGGGGPQKGGAGAKLKATVPDITGKNLKITLAAAVTAVNDGGNASYLFNNDEKKYIMVAGGGGGWGGGDGLASVVLLKPILKFGSAYTVAVNAVNGGQGAVVEYDDSTGIRIIESGQDFTTIPTLTITATDTGETLLLENGINATIRLNANNAKGGSAGGLLGAGGVGAGRSGGKGGSLGMVATKSESGVGGMGGSINNTMVGKSGASITQPPVSTSPSNISDMEGGKIGNTPGVGHGGLGETEGGCGGGGWGGGGGGGNYSGGGGGGSFGPIGTVFSSSYEEPFIQFTYLPGLTLENRQADIGILKVCQENYSDTIKYTTQFIGNELTILAARDGLLTTSKFTLTDYYAKVQILDTLSTTLKTVINRSLTLQLNTTNGLFDSTGYLLLNTEQIKYTGKDKVEGSVNNLTGISRGYNATTAQEHPDTVSVLPITFLKNNISDAVQSCTLLTALPGSGTLAGYIMIGSEKIRYTQISTDRLTLSGLIRGAESTTVAAHTTNEPVKPFTILTAPVAADGATIKVESAVESVAGYILIGDEITSITGITGNTLELTPALTNAYQINEPVYYSYNLYAPLAIPTFDLNQKKDTDTILIKTETIRYGKKTDVVPNVLNLLSNDSPPDTEYDAMDEKVIYAGKNVREFLIGLPRATVGGAVQDVQGQSVPVVNGQPITALGTRHYTLPAGVKKIKIIAVGGSGAGGLLGGLGAKVECVTTTDVTLNLLVGVGAEGQTLNGLNGGGEASIVANTTDGVIHVLAGGGGGAYGTSKISTQDSTTTLTPPADPYVNEYTYAGQVTNDAGGGGGGSGTANKGLPGGGGSSFPTKGIPAVARGNGSITLMYIEPLVVVRRKGTVLEMRQPVGTEKDLYYSLKENAVVARSKEGQETETLLPTGITHVRIKSTKSTNDYTLTNVILSGQRISTNGVEKVYTIDPDFKQVKIVLSGACGGSFSADRDGGGEGAELSGYMSLPGTIKVLTGLAGKSTEEGGGSYIKKGDDGTILLVAGGGGGSSEVRPLLIADTNNKRVLLIKDLLTADRQAITERLSLPVSVAYDAAWNIYVLDQGYNRIMKYSGTDLTFQYYLPDLDLKQPTNFVIDDQGTFYITDQQRLVSRTSQGVVKYIPLDFTPAGLCFSSSDIYLSDAVKHRVLKMDKKTSGLTTVAGLPTLNGPTGLTFRDENLYICDTDNNRLILNTTVLPLTLLLKAPRSVYVSESHIYIADTGNDRIVRIDLLPDPSTTPTILGSSGTGALQFRNPLCITGPIDYKSGMGYPGGQMKISSTTKDKSYQVASLGNTDWKTVTETQEVIEIQDTIIVKAVPQPRLGEGSVNNVYDAVDTENGTPGANYIGGNGGGILNPNAALDVKLAVPRDHGGLTITYLPKLKRLPATNMKIQPLRQEHTDSNVKYIYSAGVILGFTPEGLRTETEVSDVSDMPDSITHFVIELPNKSKYILLVG